MILSDPHNVWFWHWVLITAFPLGLLRLIFDNNIEKDAYQMNKSKFGFK